MRTTCSSSAFWGKPASEDCRKKRANGADLPRYENYFPNQYKVSYPQSPYRDPFAHANNSDQMGTAYPLTVFTTKLCSVRQPSQGANGADLPRYGYSLPLNDGRACPQPPCGYLLPHADNANRLKTLYLRRIPGTHPRAGGKPGKRPGLRRLSMKQDKGNAHLPFWKSLILYNTTN
jgi:hypothetical protein